MRLIRSPGTRIAVATAVAGLTVLGTLVATAGPAAAGTKIHATYPVTGSTFIKKPGATVRIVSLSVAGIPVPVGGSCQTSAPAVVKVKSQQGFNILNGGNLKGTYTIPQFANCGLATLLINLTIPGPGNTITLTLGKAKIG